MARILCFTTGLAGKVKAAVQLGTRLRARGHEFVVASPRDCRDAVVADGFEFAHLTHDQALRGQFDAATTDRDRREIRRRSLDDTEVEELVRSVRPDVLLIDIELHVVIIVTRSMAIPTLLTSNWYSIFPSRSNPPLHTSLTPDDALRAHAAWLGLWTTRIRRRLAGRVHRMIRREVRGPVGYLSRSPLDLAALARERGWPLRRHSTILAWLDPHTDTGFDIVAYTPVEMEFAPITHPRLHHVGPMVLGSSSSLGHGDQRWRRFAMARDAERPLVYCSMGSFWEPDRRFLEHIIDVARRRPDWDLVLGLGGRAAPGAFDRLPDNALLLELAPQLDVLRLSSAAITHGGISTINECIASGVPMVGYSTGHVEQNGNVARLVHHGLGVAGDRHRDGPDEIAAAVEAVLSDDAYRRRCVQMSRLFDTYRVEARAEELVESLLL